MCVVVKCCFINRHFPMFKTFFNNCTKHIVKSLVTHCDYDDRVMEDNINKTLTGDEFKKTFPDFSPWIVFNKDHGSNNKLEFNDIKDILRVYYRSYSNGDEIGRIEIGSDDNIKITKSHCVLEKYPVIKQSFGLTDLVREIEKNEHDLKLLLSQDWFLFKYVHDQSTELCNYVIDICPNAIQCIRDPSEEMVLRAVSMCGDALRYVSNQNFNVCMKAIEKDPFALEHVRVQDSKMCLSAVSKCGLALGFTNEIFRTEDLIKVAVQENGLALLWVGEQKQTHEICQMAVSQNGLALKYVKEKTPDICMRAIRQNPDAIRFIEKDVWPGYKYMGILKKYFDNW